MKIKKPRRGDIIFIIVLALILIPQTRKPIQVTLNKVISQFGPTVIDPSDRENLEFSSFKLMDASGEPINLKDYSGEVILLNFWATWCPPCIAELPQLQALYDDYHGKIKMVLISGENQKKVHDFSEWYKS